jgi:hypothetical protein
MTAVEFIKKRFFFHAETIPHNRDKWEISESDFEKIITEAIEMEKQQIENAWESGFNQAYKLPLSREINTPAEYYETLKTETK